MQFNLKTFLDTLEKYSDRIDPRVQLLVTGSAKDFDELLNESLNYGWRLEAEQLCEHEAGHGKARCKVWLTGGNHPETGGAVLWMLLRKHLHQIPQIAFRFTGTFEEARPLMLQPIPPGWTLSYEAAQEIEPDKYRYLLKVSTPSVVAVGQ